MAWLTGRMLLIALLVLGAGAAALAPATAGAHGVYDHQPSHLGDDGGPGHAGNQKPQIHAGLSQSCPAVPGRWCCCGSLFALSCGGKTATGGCLGWSLVLQVGVGATGFMPRAEAPRSGPSLSAARPRAPPAYS